MTGRSRSTRQSRAATFNHGREPESRPKLQQIFAEDTGVLEQPRQLQSNLDRVQKEYSDTDDAETLLRELDCDLMYLLGRAEAVNKKRGKYLAQRAPMNRLPSEVRVAGFVASVPDRLSASFTHI